MCRGGWGRLRGYGNLRGGTRARGCDPGDRVASGTDEMPGAGPASAELLTTYRARNGVIPGQCETVLYRLWTLKSRRRVGTSMDV